MVDGRVRYVYGTTAAEVFYQFISCQMPYPAIIASAFPV
jgi:hypothetical protein